MASRLHASILLVSASTLLACGSDETPMAQGPPYQVRDSAWVDIVEVDRNLWGEGEGWTLDAEPFLVIGASGDPQDELYQARGAVRLSDGRIAVANRGTQEIRVFGPDGRFTQAMGREGEGPGEFQSLMGLARRGDTLLAHDYLGTRMNFFSADGGFLGSTSFSHEGNLPLLVFPTSTGYVALHLDYTRDVPEEFKYVRRPARYVRYDADGETLGQIDELPGAEMIYRGQQEGNMTMMLSTSPLIAHQQHETVVGDRLVAAVTDRFELRVYSPEGQLERLIRAPNRERRVTGEEWDRILEEEIRDRGDTPDVRRSVEEQAEVAPAPDDRPAFGRFVGDPEGFVWVAPYRPEPGATVPWLIVDVEGPILGTVDLPRGFSPLEIGKDYVLGSIRDELDVQTVRMYRLTR